MNRNYLFGLKLIRGRLSITSSIACAAGLLVLGPTSQVSGAVESVGGLRPMVAALHVHSTISTGSLNLDQLAERAERLGLDSVVLSENFVLRYEYGVLPLRGLLKRAVALPSVLDYGIDRYLTDVAAAQVRHPRTLLIPGVEVAPHYYWTGSLLERHLTMHNSQRNFLVLGLPRPEDYAGLPVTGNPASYRFGWETALNLTPTLLLIPAGWLWQRRRYRIGRVGELRYTVVTRRRVPAAVLTGLALLLLINAWPFSQPVFSSYDERLGYQPYQTFIEAVTARGGLVVWSMPEARDFHRYSFGPLGEVTVKTEPYADALMLTTGYHGFGGVYQDTRSVTKPGGNWDQTLALYLTGQQTMPPFVFGEIAFHTPGEAGIELDQVLTVLWVREQTPAGVIEALRTGRMYAVGQYRREFGLRLDEFLVECEAGARRARSGETLDPKKAKDLAVRISVSATDRGAHPITVTIIRSGQVIARLAGQTPFAQSVADIDLPLGQSMFYRVDVQGEGGEILSNPIFVRPVMAVENGQQQ